MAGKIEIAGAIYCGACGAEMLPGSRYHRSTGDGVILVERRHCPTCLVIAETPIPELLGGNKQWPER